MILRKREKGVPHKKYLEAFEGMFAGLNQEREVTAEMLKSFFRSLPLQDRFDNVEDAVIEALETTERTSSMINNTHLGLLFKGDVFQPLPSGKRLPGHIKDVRSDRKIDLTLTPPGGEKRDELSERVLEYLKAQGGTATLTDKSPPGVRVSLVV